MNRPHLRSDGPGTRALCSRCGRTRFQTELGIGEVFSREGAGSQVVLGANEHVLGGGITCNHCGVEHAPLADYSPGPNPEIP